MSHPESSLPDAWVERIWATMRAIYGAEFDRQWECPPNVDPGAHVQSLKAVWGRELRVFQQHPKAIAYALDHLPPHPPNLVQFRQLCVIPPAPPERRIESPWASPDAVQKALAGVTRGSGHDPKAWAKRLRDREQAGERLTMAQRDMWRAALSSEIRAEAAVQGAAYAQRNGFAPGWQEGADASVEPELAMEGGRG